jgi:hypothetical protein
VTADTDDPMQDTTIVDTTAYDTPEVARAESPPVIVPASPIAQTLEHPSQTQSAQVPTVPVTPDGVTSLPYQAYVQNAPAPAMSAQVPPPPPSVQTYRPQPDAPYRPSWRGAPDADALYREQRDAEYRRVWREATAPTPGEDAPYRRRDSEYRRTAPPPPPSDEGLPFPTAGEGSPP